MGKKKKRIHLYHTFFIVTFFVIVSIIYSFQVTAQTQPNTAVVTPTPSSQNLFDAEPIHISTGFHLPLSLEKPQRIIIPRINIDIKIVAAAIVDGHWEVSEIFANHGMGTAFPGQKGNMVVFAHARDLLFLNLQNISDTDDIYVLTDKKWYVYTVSEIREVTPDQVEVIAPTADERITLFTCSGFADEKRLIVVGKRKIPDDFGLDDTFVNLLE
ncbi:MAG: sortase [Candidatus Levybacteria bacterium]|nr:sortase [Candidatus Levybacteria bacterium]